MKNPIRKIGLGIAGLALLVGINKTLPQARGDVILLTGSGCVSEDDPNHPGLEKKYEWRFDNASDEQEHVFNELRIEKQGLDKIVYKVNTPEGWTSYLDDSALVFKTTDPIYNLQRTDFAEFHAWVPDYTIDKEEVVAVAKTTQGNYSNYNKIHVPEIPEPATIGLLALGAGLLALKRKRNK